MKHTVFPHAADVETEAARLIIDTIRHHVQEKGQCVIGLSADPAWEGVWQDLVHINRKEHVPFDRVFIFSLGQYFPMGDKELQSQSREIRQLLTQPLAVPPENLHLLDGTISPDNVDQYSRDYDEQIVRMGGLDLVLPGISQSGHIGFNGPGSGRHSRTRVVTIERSRRTSLAADFFGTENVPHLAVTLGVATILEARKILAVALGEDKAPIAAQLIEGSEETENTGAPVTFLRNHSDITVLLDRSAAGNLIRFQTPWKLGPLEWTETTTRRAVKKLALSTGKAILKLTEEDYNEGGLQHLLATRGRAYDINIQVFRHFQSTITGWPGGKPAGKSGEKSGAGPGDSAGIFPKRILVFSPHPDDDVISMGGTLIRLADQGHEVHIAYQTSGNIAVFDEDALRYTDFVREFCDQFDIRSSRVVDIDSHVDRFLRNKEPGEIDSEYVRTIKGMIRRNEARAAARCCGVPESQLHFQDLPFYQTGRIRKNPISPADIQLTTELLQAVRPHQIYAAGDLSDPHGTHRTCLSILLQAVQRCSDEPWYRQCQVWLYRGAWQEWPLDQIDMAVPLSPQEVERKRIAIFKHESQKDRALFPGSDTREFWQRSEARNANTARLYDQLGLAEYEAIEGFARWDGTSGITI